MYNGRIGPHSQAIRDPVIRLETASGLWGLGWSRATRAEVEPLLGRTLAEIFDPAHGAIAEAQCVDLALWDIAARADGQPLYRLLGGAGRREVELYDGSIYIDDLDLDERGAVELFEQEVRAGQDYGFRNFKIKVGRGARWMPPAEGLARDALVVGAVRQAAGPTAKIMIDANMGNTLNTALELIRLTAESRLYWFEEPFAEDPAINRALKEAIAELGLGLLVADGEFHPPATFRQMVADRLIDVVQYDFRFKGLTFWREAAADIVELGALCAPHAWGSYVERFPHAHFAASVPHYALLEAAPSVMPGVWSPGWEIREGCLCVPDTPGCGFEVDPELLERHSRGPDGFDLRL
jgi:L-alanine-DL-glutamate epimerase-like enolase superfamily enzyme